MERLTRDPGAKYEPRAVLALLATDPPPPAAAPSTPGESPPYDPRPPINVCDRFDMMAELSSELLRRRMLGHLKLYLQHFNPANAPQVGG